MEVQQLIVGLNADTLTQQLIQWLPMLAEALFTGFACYILRKLGIRNHVINTNHIKSIEAMQATNTHVDKAAELISGYISTIEQKLTEQYDINKALRERLADLNFELEDRRKQDCELNKRLIEIEAYIRKEE